MAVSVQPKPAREHRLGRSIINDRIDFTGGLWVGGFLVVMRGPFWYTDKLNVIYLILVFTSLGSIAKLSIF
jgi:hypothetical protein